MKEDMIEDKYKYNPEKWVLPQRKMNLSKKKYSLILIFFIAGLVFVSTIKNETRKLEKEISELQASLNEIKITLHEATLDYQVITSPENINKLAKKYLDYNFTFYKKIQMKKLGREEVLLSTLNMEKKNLKRKEKIKLLTTKIIEEKKREREDLKELYSRPEELPDEIKKRITKKIETKKSEIKELYTNPNSTIYSNKAQKWAVLQIVKAFLGIPIIPGK